MIQFALKPLVDRLRKITQNEEVCDQFGNELVTFLFIAHIKWQYFKEGRGILLSSYINLVKAKIFIIGQRITLPCQGKYISPRYVMLLVTEWNHCYLWKQTSCITNLPLILVMNSRPITLRCDDNKKVIFTYS